MAAEIVARRVEADQAFATGDKVKEGVELRRPRETACQTGVVQHDAIVFRQVLPVGKTSYGIGQVNRERTSLGSQFLDRQISVRDRGVNEAFTAIENQNAAIRSRLGGRLLRNRLRDRVAVLPEKSV